MLLRLCWCVILFVVFRCVVVFRVAVRVRYAWFVFVLACVVCVLCWLVWFGLVCVCNVLVWCVCCVLLY